MAGTVDFVPVEPFSSTDLSERLADIATEEAVAQAGIGSKGDFPGPLFLAVAPVEVEWPQRFELARAVGSDAEFDYDALLRVSVGGKFTPYHHRFMFGSVADHLADTFGTKGSPISLSTACASGASAIQLGVEAIRRGANSRCRAVRCHRRLGQSGSIGAVLVARRRCRPTTIRRRRRCGRLPRTATVS